MYCAIPIFAAALALAGLSARAEVPASPHTPAAMSATSRSQLTNLCAELTAQFDRLRPKVIQPAEGYLKYPYLIPGGYYKQMWDWDGFFMGNHFVSRRQPEYLKYWALNLIAGIDAEGYTAGCVNTKGPRPIFGKFAMKPFLSQGVFLAASAMKDFSWVEPHYDALVKVLEYRDRTQRDTNYGLYFWDNAMQSGADNNPALNYFTDDKRSFLACDASTFQLREFLAQAKLAAQLGKPADAAKWQQRADTLKTAINQHLWCAADQVYYNVNRETGAFYRRVSYGNFIPLIQSVASPENGRAMIRRYLLNEAHLKAAYGLRSLSQQDPDYNNVNMIAPFSNWQGPVWPIANYLYSLALKNYGFDRENEWLAATLGQLLLDDVKRYGTMHENYHADTGAPLAPSHDHKNPDGSIVGFISWNLCIQNLLEGVAHQQWMRLEL